VEGGAAGGRVRAVGRFEGFDDEAGARVVGRLPADGHPGGQVDDDSEAGPALAVSGVGGVAGRVGRGGRAVEAAARQVRAAGRVRGADRGPLRPARPAPSMPRPAMVSRTSHSDAPAPSRRQAGGDPPGSVAAFGRLSAGV
jgi:hypothetical protein